MKNTPLDMTCGTVHNTNGSGLLEIVKYKLCSNVAVRFIDTGYECNASSGNIRKGEVKDRLLRSVYGVGFYGVAGIKKPTKHKAYSSWMNMIKRCYSDISLSESPTYFGCDVCDEWHDFQVYAKWFEQNYIDGFQLDKDIKTKGNTTYGPEACSFVSHKENSSAAHSKAYRFVDPMGFINESVNIVDLSKRLGVNPAGFYDLARGSTSSYNGWTITSESESFRVKLISAANELKKLIDEKNKIAKITHFHFELQEPEFHDYQTCQELIEIAKKI